VEIRHEFTGDERSLSCVLQVAADARYAAWLNGVLIGTGPFSDWPATRSVDEWKETKHLRPGKNVLALLVYELGAETASYTKGAPGVIYALTHGKQTLAMSGEDNIRWRLSPTYQSGPMPRITPQLPFTFLHDATGEDGWRDPEYSPGKEWSDITAADCCEWQATGRNLRPRPLPACELRDRLPATVVAQGHFKRSPADVSLAARMQHDWLSARTVMELFTGVNAAPVALTASGLALRNAVAAEADGAYLIVDLGREAVGYLELEVAAGAGTVIEIAFGEHLDDLRVRSHIGSRNFASAYRCRAGRQIFQYSITRLGARYLQLHVSGIAGEFTLFYAGLRELAYPVALRGKFNTPDGLQNRIHAVAVNTLRLCLHDHYDDCPWREQALFANDLLNQSLAGYYVSGDYRFPQVSLELMGEGLQADGILELCAPARVPVTIPSFTMAWVLAVERNLRFSGDIAFARAIFPKVKMILSRWLERRSNGLMPSPCGARYWQFYDWAPGGLDGTVANDCTRFAELHEPRFDAPLNAFFILGLAAGAILADAIGDQPLAAQWRKFSEQLRAAFHTAFWNHAESIYSTFTGSAGTLDCRSELTQALALCAGCCPPDEARTLRCRLLAPRNELIGTTLSQSLWKFEALLPEPEWGAEVMDVIASQWGGMLERNATTFWETLKGGWDFDGAGSLCHGWSATPVYFYGAYLLGIRPLEAGFRSFSVSPPAGRNYDGLRGVVPTPAGDITIAWERSEGCPAVRLSHPDALRPVFSKEVRRLPEPLIPILV
jgi:hypothetical protein